MRNLFAMFAVTLPLIAAPSKTPTWTDPVKAAAENADFAVQGEYVGKKDGRTVGVQVVVLSRGAFLTATYAGGLPGAGWDGTPSTKERADSARVKVLTAGLERVERKSPTMGALPPDGATVLFDGTSVDAFAGGKLDGNLLTEGTRTKASFGDFKLHLEFRLPCKPERQPSNQDRGNSGVYIFNRYETQILDTFGLDFDASTWAPWGIKPQSKPEQWCGCFYRTKCADVNMCLPPLSWQTYDIEFAAPRFEDGKKTSNARITVLHNGIKIHDAVELSRGTGAGGKRPEIPRGQIFLQGHGNPVRFRNIWIVEQ